MTTEELQELEEIEYAAEQKANKNLALVLLGITTLVAVGAIAIALVVPLFYDAPEIESEVLSSLVTLATLGVGALAALLGGGNRS